MLLLSDIDACIPVAQEVGDAGKVLEPKIGPLALLVSEVSVATAASASVAADDDVVLKNYIPHLAEMMHECSASVIRVENTSVFDTSRHDVKIEEFSDLVAQGVTAEITRARGIVIPAIKRLEDAIGEGLKSYEDRSIANIGIDEVGLNGILDCEQVFDYFGQYKELRIRDVVNANIFPALDAVAVAKLINSGDPELDAHLQEAFVNEAANGSLGMFVYNQFYRGDSLNDTRIDPYIIRNTIKTIYGDAVGIEGILIAYYIGKGLIENLPDGVNGGLRDVEYRVNTLTKGLGLIVFGEIEKHRKQIGEKLLFPIGLPYVDRSTGKVNAKYSIRVNAEVYADFLANGGSPEVIYGTMVSDRNTDIDYLINNREKYEAAYDKFVSLNRSYTAASRLEVYQRSIRDEFYKMVDDTEELKDMKSGSGVFVRLKDALNRMGNDHISSPENTYKFLRSAVSSILYPDRPQVEKIISSLDDFVAREGEENLSTAEVANIVLIDLIVDWLCDQVVVRKA